MDGESRCITDTAGPDAGAGLNEAPFALEELFFSRTDGSGIIKAANSVFRHISGYTGDELFNKPHKIIRHPDMPRAVFYLLWDFLKRGKPIGAYVKNRAKDGRYYWVFAIATPLDDGYLSVRLKPSSPIFAVIRDAYKAHLAFETENAVSPKESADHLLATLGSLGFGSYEEFMSVALRTEIASRSAALGRKIDTAIDRFEELSEMAKTVIAETKRIHALYDENQYVPLNLQIQSCQLGEDGKTIGVISTNYGTLSVEMRAEIDKFAEAAHGVFNTIYESQFLLCSARVQNEVAEFFNSQEPEDTPERDKEAERLQRQHHEYEEKARLSLDRIVRNIDEFRDTCRKMKMCAASLEVIRVMGMVDAARLSTSRAALNELIEDLKLFQSSVAGNLNEIERCNAVMQHNTQKALHSLARL